MISCCHLGCSALPIPALLRLLASSAWAWFRGQPRKAISVKEINPFGVRKEIWLYWYQLCHTASLQSWELWLLSFSCALFPSPFSQTLIQSNSWGWPLSEGANVGLFVNWNYIFAFLYLKITLIELICVSIMFQIRQYMIPKQLFLYKWSYVCS